MVRRKWLVSKIWDVSIFAGPLLIAIVFSYYWWQYGSTAKAPLWTFLFLIVAFDVAHVWATAYRTYLDPNEIRRRPSLYLGILGPTFLISAMLHIYDPIIFWTVIAYIALWHFVRQPYGFIVIYKFLHKETNALDFHLDRISVYIGALAPILAWHASPDRRFDWFGHGEQFLIKLPESLKVYIAVIYFGFASIYCLRQFYLLFVGKFNLGKQLVMSITWITWAVGISVSNPLISAAFINLFHGIPFLAVTWLYGNSKYKQGFLGKIFRTKNLALFLLLIFIPAFIEEGLWDAIFWHEYSFIFPVLLSDSTDTYLLSICCALLIMPQLIHYILDAFIWKMDSSNPDLRQHLGLL